MSLNSLTTLLEKKRCPKKSTSVMFRNCRMFGWNLEFGGFSGTLDRDLTYPEATELVTAHLRSQFL